MDTHNCPTRRGPACPYCGHRLTIINDACNCLPCIERSIKELQEHFEAKRNAVS